MQRVCGRSPGVPSPPDRRYERADFGTRPPGSGLAPLGARGESITKQPGADEARCFAAERIASQQPQRRPVGLEEPAQESHEPALLSARREWVEPHQPIEAQV